MFHGQRWRKNKLYQSTMMETPSMQVYVGDFVNFSHSSLGITCGKVQRFYMKVIIVHDTCTFCSTLHCCKIYYKQENHRNVFIEVQMLLNIEQFCRACPQARATMYCNPNCVVKHKVCEVLSSDVIATVPPPNVILQWDPYSDIFHRISLEVHKNVYLDKA